MVRQIGAHSRYLYAAPSYLKKFGTPEHPADLAEHRLIANSASQSLNMWPFRKSTLDTFDSKAGNSAAAWLKKPQGRETSRSSKTDTLLVKGHTRADSTAIVVALALEGVGIARLNELLVSPLVRRGALKQVLADYTAEECIPIYAAMLQERHRLPKVRACIDYWQESFAQLRNGETGVTAGLNLLGMR